MKIENVMIKISGGNDQVLLKNGRSPGTGGNSPKTSTRLEGEGFQISPKKWGGVQNQQIADFFMLISSLRTLAAC